MPGCVVGTGRNEKAFELISVSI